MISIVFRRGHRKRPGLGASALRSRFPATIISMTLDIFSKSGELCEHLREHLQWRILYHEDIFGLREANSQFYGDIIGFGEEMSELALWPYVEVIAETQPGQAILLYLRIRSSMDDCHALTLAISGIYRAYLAGGCVFHGRICSHSPKKRGAVFRCCRNSNHFLRPGAFRARSFRVTREA